MIAPTHRWFPVLLTACLIAHGATPRTAGGQSASSQDLERFDVLFLAMEAPLWLSVRIEGAAGGLHSVRQRYARTMIQIVDDDGDGRADASEAARLPAGGRLVEHAALLGNSWTAFDTSPADGYLSPDEYLVAVEGRLGAPLRVRRKPPLLQQSVQLFSRLDGDRDGEISVDEIHGGPQSLTAFDFDDDGTFSPAELQPFPQSMLDAAMSDAASSEPQPFVVVDSSVDRESLRAMLYQKYAGKDGVRRDQSGLSEFAFDAADLDGSGSLDESEAESLLHPRPAVEIVVNLVSGRVRIGRLPRSSERVTPLPVENSRRTALQLGSEPVEFSAHDNRYAASDQIKLLKIRFLQGDTDKNGYMGEQEFTALAGIEAGFADVDADGDGKVFIEELERFLRIESYLAQCSLELEVDAIEKPLFTILDSNQDRRLGAREFADVLSRLQEFDQNGDGALDARELDVLSRFRVRFSFVVPPAVRPEQNTDMMSRRRMPLIGRMPRTGPDWFLNMDRNQDSELTWREFQGPRNVFERLDADSSGWIDASEAEQSGSSGE